MKPKIIGIGAEAIITLKDNQVTKNRVKKSYRILQLDNKLRKKRTKSETKIIEKLKNIIPVPKIIKSNNLDIIDMQYIKGKKLSDNLESLDYKKILKQISNNISIMHDQDIIHGDLTTSNMIYQEDENKVYFIDFGLAFHSYKIEDKAVDLHLLKQALDSKHYKIADTAIKIILNNYKAKQSKQILERIKAIEKRGRYKGH
ncbi:Kae1-associated serine/threonine protein kinase [Candidatus Pacearchaeota archaeon]|nr:Kae1-associated serine/threonine protein kinase [Candidatus Pacearchaeota archaeon]